MLDYFDSEIATMNPRSAASPRKCVLRLRQYAAQRPLRFADVTPEFVEGFRQWLSDDGLKPTVIADYSQRFRALYRRAVRRGLAPKTDAFASVEKQAPRAVALPPVAVAPAEDRVRWYALRLMPGVDMTRAEFCGLEIYNPSVEIARRVGRNMALKARAAIRGVVFLRARNSETKTLTHRLRSVARFYTVDSAPAIIPDAEMYCFRRTIGMLGDSMEFLPLDRAAWRAGRRVRITGGAFEGYEGLLVDVVGPDGRLLRDITVSLISTFGFTVRATIPDIYITPL